MSAIMSVSIHQPRDCLLNRLFKAHIKDQSSASLTFVGEFTGDWWFPYTKGQWRGKSFPFGDVIMKTGNWNPVSESMLTDYHPDEYCQFDEPGET